MKKIIILFILLFGINAYSQNFSNVDTVIVTLSSSSFTRVTLGSGVKAITVDNRLINATLSVGFSPNGSVPDTINTYPISAYNQYTFPNRLNNYMYLKNGATSTIPVIIDYGTGIPFYPLPVITINGLVPSDTTTALRTEINTLNENAIDVSNYRNGDMAMVKSGAFAPTSIDSLIKKTYKAVDSITVATNDSVTLTATQQIILINAGDNSIIKLDSSLTDGKEYELIFLAATNGITIHVNDGFSALICKPDRSLTQIYEFEPSPTICYLIKYNKIWYIK